MFYSWVLSKLSFLPNQTCDIDNGISDLLHRNMQTDQFLTYRIDILPSQFWCKTLLVLGDEQISWRSLNCLVSTVFVCHLLPVFAQTPTISPVSSHASLCADWQGALDFPIEYMFLCWRDLLNRRDYDLHAFLLPHSDSYPSCGLFWDVR